MSRVQSGEMELSEEAAAEFVRNLSANLRELHEHLIREGERFGDELAEIVKSVPPEQLSDRIGEEAPTDRLGIYSTISQAILAAVAELGLR